jgi:hypothetical protein
MKIQDKLKKHPPFDVASGLAAALISSGTHEQVITTVERKPPSTQWAAVRGNISGDYEEQPFIYHYCATCGSCASWSGPTVFKTQRARHCGVVEVPPQDVVEKYVELWNTREKKKRRSKPITISSSNVVTNPLILGHFGIKSREQLILQMRSDARLAELAKKK